MIRKRLGLTDRFFVWPEITILIMYCLRILKFEHSFRFNAHFVGSQIGIMGGFGGLYFLSQCLNRLPNPKMLWFYAAFRFFLPHILCFLLRWKIPIFRCKKSFGGLQKIKNLLALVVFSEPPNRETRNKFIGRIT